MSPAAKTVVIPNATNGENRIVGRKLLVTRPTVQLAMWSVAANTCVWERVRSVRSGRGVKVRASDEVRRTE